MGKRLLKEAKAEVKELRNEGGVKLHKDTKERIKEIKDVVKEIKEKELKEGKEKDKDGKELKERIKEIKEIKEREVKIREVKSPKETVEGKLLEVDRRFIEVGPSADVASDFGARLELLEQLVAQLAHFIAPELRPDLGTGALVYEDDYEGWQSDLDQASKEAKDYKDNKDVEKPPER